MLDVVEEDARVSFARLAREDLLRMQAPMKHGAEELRKEKTRVWIMLDGVQVNANVAGQLQTLITENETTLYQLESDQELLLGV